MFLCETKRNSDRACSLSTASPNCQGTTQKLMGDTHTMYSGLELNMFNGSVFMTHQTITGMETSKYTKRTSSTCHRHTGAKTFMKMHEFPSFQYASNPGIPAILCPALQVCEESSGLELQQGSLSTHSGEHLMPCDCLPLINELSRWLDPFLLSKNDNDKTFNFAGHQQWPSYNRPNRRTWFLNHW